MWIKRKGSPAVNLQYATHIEMDEDGEEITFFFDNEEEVTYEFNSKGKCKEYYDSIMDIIGAREVDMLKIS